MRVPLAVPLRIRSARNADGSAVRALVYAVLAEYGLAADRGTKDADLDDIEGHYLVPGGRFDLLEDARGGLFGTVGLMPRGAGRVELRKLYLTPALRGQGQGKALLAHALASAQALGFDRVELETAGVLVEAIALYRRFGFEPIADQPCAAHCDQAFALELRSWTPPSGLRRLHTAIPVS